MLRSMLLYDTDILITIILLLVLSLLFCIILLGPQLAPRGLPGGRQPHEVALKRMYTYIYIYMYMYMYMDMYVYISLSLYIYIYTHTHIYIYIYIYRERERERVLCGYLCVFFCCSVFFAKVSLFNLTKWSSGKAHPHTHKSQGFLGPPC